MSALPTHGLYLKPELDDTQLSQQPKELDHKTYSHRRTLWVRVPHRECRPVSNDYHYSPSPCQRNIHPPKILQKAYLVASVTSHSHRDNNVSFSNLKTIDARDFNARQVGQLFSLVANSWRAWESALGLVQSVYSDKVRIRGGISQTRSL
jgi:hypothetical protein